jgi:anti-sigma factor RsiW
MNHLTNPQIQEYVDGVATNDMETHVRACPECLANVNICRKLEEALHALPPEPLQPRFTERVMNRLNIGEAPSFAWALLRNLAPIVGLVVVTGLVFVAFTIAGAFEETELQQSTAVTRTLYNQVGSVLGAGLEGFNGWVTKYFSFAFAKSTYGLTGFVLIFFGAIALLDKYVLMPMMRRRV